MAVRNIGLHPDVIVIDGVHVDLNWFLDSIGSKLEQSTETRWRRHCPTTKVREVNCENEKTRSPLRLPQSVRCNRGVRHLRISGGCTLQADISRREAIESKVCPHWTEDSQTASVGVDDAQRTNQIRSIDRQDAPGAPVVNPRARRHRRHRRKLFREHADCFWRARCTYVTFRNELTNNCPAHPVTVRYGR